MDAAKGIPAKVRHEADEIIDRFNRYVLGGSVLYVTRFKGRYLYLDRMDVLFSKAKPIGRLEFVGELTNWRFAIYKYSSDRYDPEEC